MYPQNEIIQSKLSVVPRLRHAGLENKDISLESIIRVNKRCTKIPFILNKINGISPKTQKIKQNLKNVLP